MDPDLLLAIALTQPLTMEEPKKEYIDEVNQKEKKNLFSCNFILILFLKKLLEII